MTTAGLRRKRSSSLEGGTPHGTGHGSQSPTPRRFQYVYYGSFEIQPWYPSPYMLEDTSSAVSSQGGNSSKRPRDSEATPPPSHSRRGASKQPSERSPRPSSKTGQAATPRPPGSNATPNQGDEDVQMAGLGGEQDDSLVNMDQKDDDVHYGHGSRESSGSPLNKIPRRGAGGRFLPKDPSKPGGRALFGLKHELESLKHSVLTAPPPPGQEAPATMTPWTEKMWVCDGCFAYMVQPAHFILHRKSCNYRHPPGKKVYQKGAHIIWEVDGAAAKLYCQCLCLFGKLFIDHKYVFFDVEGFVFYVLTDATGSSDHALGFFSKEKFSYDNHNLACIVIFPPFQKKNFGTLLIEFSYEIWKRTNQAAGTPERPLSSLGLNSYLSYWSFTLVRYLSIILDIDDRQMITIKTGNSVSRPSRRHVGWQGEGPRTSRRQTTEKSESPSVHPDEEGDSRMNIHYEGREESLTTVSKPSTITLEELGGETGIAPADVSVALIYCGLARYRRHVQNDDRDNDEDDEDAGPSVEIIITPSLVREAISKLKLKAPLLDASFML